MKITKYQHACFTVEKDGKLLVVDPGQFTSDLGSPENVVSIVVTHAHSDHFDPNALGALIAHNPDALIVAPSEITEQLGDTLPSKAVNAGDELTLTPFDLKFFGGEHAIIHSSRPNIANVGVLIDERIYYPGDSFTVPERPVEVLALPVSAPWLKISETMDFLTTVKPHMAFPTHDAILSQQGNMVVDMMVSGLAEQNGIEYRRLTEPVEI